MDWWDAVVSVVQDLGPRRRHARALAMSCTSGSLCAVDDHGEPVGQGLLYADARASVLDGTDSSWAIAKIAWLAGTRPDLVERAPLFTSPGGFITGRLLRDRAPIDVTQGLKFGHDPATGWRSPYPVPIDLLPAIVPTGTRIGSIDPAMAALLGLPSNLELVAGATDGISGQIACRPAPERWATSIGSTIVWKVMSRTRIDTGGIYSHGGPDGWWFPGAASNAGARVLSSWASPAELDRFGRAIEITPAVEAVYPIVGKGERFPFADADFASWSVTGCAPGDRYAGEVLGIALVERWGCDVLVEQGCERPETIATTGGVAVSDSFTRLRCDVLQRPIEVPVEPSSAFGAAVVAAAPSFGGILQASASMVQFARCFEPEPADAGRWDEVYERFRLVCARRREDEA